MPFMVAVVGKPRDPALATVIEEFEKRAARYWPVSFRELRVPSAASAPPAVVLRSEGDRLLASVIPGSAIVACDVEGTQMTSREFATWLERERDGGRSCTFLIGGAHGLDERIRSSATIRLSLSRMTLTHEHARLMLAEQLYRAGTISRGEPYHK